MLDSLGQVLPHAARRFGDKTAVVFGSRVFTFRELDTLSSRLARSLRELGIQPGDRVTLYAPNCWEWIVSYYAIARVGAVINPINAMLTSEEVRYVVEDCGATALLATPDKGLPLLKTRPPRLREMVLFGDDVAAGARSFNTLLQAAGVDERLNGESDSDQAIVRQPEDLSTICYTSGTTGHPKGAMLSHRAVLLNAAMFANMHVRTAADTVVHGLPLPHVYGNIIMNSAFLYGLTVVVLEHFTAEDALRAIEVNHATIFDGVPTMYLYMLNSPALERTNLSSLTRCFVGGQTMPVAKMQQVEVHFRCPLFELWGMTELAGIGTTNTVNGPNRLGSIGLAIPYVQCRIADVANAARTLEPDEVGELMLRGPIVMQGYFANPEATRDTIEPDGWLHTGDLARMDVDGYIYVVDRKKDMILTGGYNVYPAEIERVIAQHPSVALVAVGGLPDDLKGEIAKAYIVCRTGATPTEAEILAFCRERLASYKLPRAVQFVEDLPKTSTGKVMRRMLRTLDAAQPLTVPQRLHFWRVIDWHAGLPFEARALPVTVMRPIEGSCAIGRARL
jgi:long-chain acyl-CoA synthetase